MGTLFSTYRHGENRVTSTILSVFQFLRVPILERLLQIVMGESSLSLVVFSNQWQSLGERNQTIPDGVITANFSLLIETKTARNAVERDQILGHLDQLDRLSTGKGAFARLLVITPDYEVPHDLAEIEDDRVRWIGFSDIRDAIGDILSQNNVVVTEVEELLLRELVEMFDEDGLLDRPYNTVVVAARDAYPLYRNISEGLNGRYSAYICQPNRSFREVEYLGFYRNRQIEPLFPKILGIWDEIVIDKETVDDLDCRGEEADCALRDVLNWIIDNGVDINGPHKVMLLSGEADGRTKRRDMAITHDGRGAWTRRHTYVDLERALQAETTAGLRS